MLLFYNGSSNKPKTEKLLNIIKPILRGWFFCFMIMSF
ncbi:hypothetical protein MuYL_1299 [Mucilaginibacter xinganensis]|uniref:Uncharacterized protein n=1 Tax=Mucilaginibacter xinganensis TaxID=1234841 RepID=A0A223NTL5_9SPHI|nr:hypothetical protein MuYL_1299 [Mucilaginibacter xinganensis]